MLAETEQGIGEFMLSFLIPSENFKNRLAASSQGPGGIGLGFFPC